MPRTATLALDSPPLASARMPGTPRSRSVALAAVTAPTPSLSMVEMATLERILDLAVDVPVTTTASSLRPSVDSRAAPA